MGRERERESPHTEQKVINDTHTERERERAVAHTEQKVTRKCSVCKKHIVYIHLLHVTPSPMLHHAV